MRSERKRKQNKRERKQRQAQQVCEDGTFVLLHSRLFCLLARLDELFSFVLYARILYIYNMCAAFLTVILYLNMQHSKSKHINI